MAEYVITDGSRWIMRDRCGKYVPTASESLADTWSKKQAEGIFNNSLPKALKCVFYVQKYDTPPKNVKQVTQDDIQNSSKQAMRAENIQRWLDKLSGLNGLAKEASDRKEFLLEQLSLADRKKSDYLHWLEAQKFNAAQGYQMAKWLKDLLMERRSIKNELAVLDIILGKKLNESMEEEITQAVAALDERTYQPRVLKEHFDV